LGSKLVDLEDTRRHAESELSRLRSSREQIEELEADRDALLASMSETIPESLDSLTGEERNQVYRMLRLEVTPSEEGYELSGAFCTSEYSRCEGIALALLREIQRTIPVFRIANGERATREARFG
jgi:hypothetical protein